MTDAPTLKPCPFCGGEAELRTVEFVGCEYVKCEKCGVSSDDHGKGSARTAWNTRAAPKVKALEWGGYHCESYSIEVSSDGIGTLYTFFDRDEDGEPLAIQSGFLTLVNIDDLKAAARADYERRILDALE